MKGTICGRRAGFAALLSALSVAVAPAIAQADVSVGSVTSAAPSASTAPAAPSVPAPATPAIPTPVATVTAHVATPVASVAVDSASVSTSGVKADKVHVQTGPAVVNTVAKVKQVAKAIVKQTVNSSSVTKDAVATVKKVHGATAKTVKPITKTVIRVLTWTNGDGNGEFGEEPTQGCVNWGGWMCQRIPNSDFPTTNFCSTVNGVPEQVVLNGTLTIWTKTTTTTNLWTMKTTMTVQTRTFFIGFKTVSSSYLNLYKGWDQQNDSFKTFTFAGNVPGGFRDDNREFERLTVTKKDGINVPQDMFLSVHTIFGVDGGGNITVDISKVRIVCSKGQQAPDDDDQGDHKQCDEHHHNTDDYGKKGYNHDQNTSWNDD